MDEKEEEVIYSRTLKSSDICRRCSDLEKRYKRYCQEPHLFVTHAERFILTGRKTPEKRKILNKIAEIASALRNTKGGEIIIHIDGQKETDRDLEKVDESVGKILNDLIEDGSLYTDCFTRDWLSVVNSNFKEHDFLLVRVLQTDCVSTTVFNTKIRNDFENVTPNTLNIVKLLNRAESPALAKSFLRGFPSENIAENRHIEVKDYQPSKKEETDPDRLVEYIWESLKLKHNVSSLSKLNGGGSFYIGVAETARKGSYKTKIRQINSFVLHLAHEEIERRINERVQTDTSVLTLDGRFDKTPEDLIQVKFYDKEGKYILEVAVRNFDGIVFTDCNGPSAHIVDENGKVTKMDREQWYERLANTCKPWPSDTSLTSK